jgi:hypothetical protein
VNDLKEDCEAARRLLFPLLDASLERQEEAWVSSHIEKCPECSKEMKILQRMITIVRQNEEALCPEPEGLFLFVNFGEDPGGAIKGHVNTCFKCQRFAEQCKILPRDEVMPRQLMQKLTLEGRKEESESSLGIMLWQIYDFLTLKPVMAAAVAVATLVVIALWPGAYPKPRIALSSVTWKKPSISLMTPFAKPGAAPGPTTKERLAVVIVLENFKDPMPQDEVDALYQALRPTAAIRKNFDLIPPDELKKLVETKKIATGEVEQILTKLREDSGVANALVVKIVAEGRQYSVRSAFVDTETRSIAREAVANGLTAADLEKKLPETAYSVMLK